MMFYDWCECVMSILGTTKHSSATVLTLGNKVVLYCIALVENEHLKCPKRCLICKVVGISTKQCCCADLNEHYMPVLFKTPIFYLIQVSQN